MDSEERWRYKVNPQKVLDEGLDGRTAQGLKRAADRAMANPHKKVEGARLRNFWKLITTCQSLSSEVHVLQTPWVELELELSYLKEEGVVSSDCLQRNLLKRRVKDLIFNKTWDELVACLNPFKEAARFDDLKAELAALNMEMKLKMLFFSSLLLGQGLVPVICLGQEAEAELLKFLSPLLKALEDVDLVDLDGEAAATTHSQALSACRGLAAMLDESFL
eukprot:4231755-Amphidinium_carterae.1